MANRIGMPRIKSGWAALLLGLAAILPEPAGAQSVPVRQHMQYELYAAGLDAVTATLDVQDGAGLYKAHLDASTRGILGKVVPWHGTFDTTGWMGQDRLQAQQHRSTATMRDGLDVDTYTYGRGGAFLTYTATRKGVDKTPNPLDRSLTDGTTDVLTAAMQIMIQLGRGGSCDSSNEIFDGERRYRLVFRETGHEQFPASAYNIFSGNTTRCEAEVIPLTGKWHKKPRGWMSIQEQGRKAGSLPTIWLAKIGKDGPAIPVRMRVTTDYGTLYMHITGYANNESDRSTMQDDRDDR